MRKLGLLIVTLLVCVVNVSCDVDFVNPVNALSSSEAVAGEILGTWTVVTVGSGFAATPPGTVKITQNQNGSLHAELEQAGNKTSLDAALGMIGGRIVASVPSSFENWNLYVLEVDAAKGEMRIKGPNTAILQADIEAGVVQGKVTTAGDATAVGVTASSEDLRSYLANRQNLFDDLLASLKKVQ